MKIKPQYKLTRRERQLVWAFIKKWGEKPMDDLNARGWHVFGKWKLCFTSNHVVCIEKHEEDPWYNRTITDFQLVEIERDGDGKPESPGVLGFGTPGRNDEQTEADGETVSAPKDNADHENVGRSAGRPDNHGNPA